MSKMIKQIAIGLLAVMLIGCGKLNNSDTSKEAKESDVATSESAEVGESSSAPGDLGNNTEVNYEEVYAEIIDEYATMITLDTNYLEDGIAGISEMLMYENVDYVLENTGYAIIDLSGDNTPELIIANPTEPMEIYAVYTVIDGEASFVFEGWSRNRYYLLEDNYILNEGSSGAADSSVGKYRLSEDGTMLVCEELWYTASTDDNEIGYYYSENGDREASVLYEGEETEFWAECDKLSELIVPFELTTFAEYEGEDSKTHDELELSVVWAKEVEGDVSDYEEFIESEGEYVARIAYINRKDIKNLKVLDLEYQDANDRGPIFGITEVYNADEAMNTYPLIVQVTMAGTIPNSGISYEDADGVTRYFSVSISGEDGSLILTEFYLD